MHSSRSSEELPRGLVFLAALWLIGSWGLSIGLRRPVEPSSASYTPGVRMMLLCVAIGIMIAWPLLRLSQRSTPRPVAQTLLDLAVLGALIQVVIWPLRLVTPWSPLRTAAVDATLLGWMLLAGAVIGSAIGSSRPGPRVLAMIACVCMCLLGPTAAWLGVLTDVNFMELIELSPLMAVRTLTRGAGSPPTIVQWRWIGLLLFAAAASWMALTLWLRLAPPNLASRRAA